MFQFRGNSYTKTLFANVCVCITYVYLCIYLCMHGHSCLYAHVYMDMKVYMRVHECVCEHVYGCTSVLTCLHMFVCMYG